MIFLLHHTIKDSVHAQDAQDAPIPLVSKDPTQALFELAEKYPDELIIWCDHSVLPFVDRDKILEVFHHRRIMASFSTSGDFYISEAVEYLEDNPYHKIPRDVLYPTWKMSSDIGGIYSETLLLFKETLQLDKRAISRKRTLQYDLHTISKLGMRQGLLCYHAPLLSEGYSAIAVDKVTDQALFKFVRTHYRLSWIFFLITVLWRYDRRFPFGALLRAWALKPKKIFIHMEDILVDSSKPILGKHQYDVIIPTMGRASFLHNVLIDFAAQNVLPKKIIIIEQNADTTSHTELNYITAEDWPFEIEHHFIHQTGACNARNMALARTTAPWVFFADDDNRFEATVVADIFNSLEVFGVKALTTSYLQAHEKQMETIARQWATFGAGNSFVDGDAARGTRFDMALEFGYGEDADYGAQLRNKGIDILLEPAIDLLHLKAPVGGFRKKVSFPWEADEILPKPSPTVMYQKLKNRTKKQLTGYRLVLALKFFRHQKLKNPILYHRYYRKAWDQSLHWAAHLKSKTS